jgi:hypothetical protein
MIVDDTTMADLDIGAPAQGDPLASELSDEEMADTVRSQSDSDSGSEEEGSDVETSDEDTDSESDDDDDLFREDQFPGEQFITAFRLAWNLGVCDTAAADMLAIFNRIGRRDARRELTHGQLHSDKEGETRVRWLTEEHAIFEKFVDMHAAELQRMEDAKKSAPFPIRAKFDRLWENRPQSLRSPLWDGAWREDLYQLWDTAIGCGDWR